MNCTNLVTFTFCHKCFQATHSKNQIIFLLFVNMGEESDLEESQRLLGDDDVSSSSGSVEKANMESLDFDEVLTEINGFGKYQITFYLLLCLPAMFTATITLANTFVTAQPNHRCDIPFCDDKLNPQYDDAFVGPNYFSNYTLPLDESSLSKYSMCQYYKPITNTTTKSLHEDRRSGKSIYSHYQPNEFVSNAKEPKLDHCDPSDFNQSLTIDCTKYIYDQSNYFSTVVTQWNLVCSSNWKIPLIESVFFAGVGVGAPLFGILADKYGRKPTLMMSILMTVLFGVPLGLAPNYYVFLSLQFFVAMGQLGIFQTCFVMVVELVSKKRRVLCGIAIEYFFDLGAIILTGVAYYFRDWSSILLFATCPVGLFLMYWPILPESVRWLLIKKKYKEAEKEIHRISIWNRRPIDLASIGSSRSQQLRRVSDLQQSNENRRAQLAETNNGEILQEDTETSQNDNVRIEFQSGEDYRAIHRNDPVDNGMSRDDVSETFLTFLRTPVMLARHLNICYSWFVITLVYYGLSLVSWSVIWSRN